MSKEKKIVLISALMFVIGAISFGMILINLDHMLSTYGTIATLWSLIVPIVLAGIGWSNLEEAA